MPGFRKEVKGPYAPTDVLPYTRKQLERHILETEKRHLELITSVIDLVKALGVSGKDVQHLGIISQIAVRAVETGQEKKRKTAHKRGCECKAGACKPGNGNVGQQCKCSVNGNACVGCKCEGCENPFNNAMEDDAALLAAEEARVAALIAKVLKQQPRPVIG